MAPVVAIIEDDSATIAAMTEMLTEGGYGTFQWRQASGAFEVIREARPSAVILDVRMEHERAGLAVLERLRADGATAAIPVLVCTADHRFVRDWQDTLARQRCSVLAKPFPLADLLSSVRALIAPADPAAVALPPIAVPPPAPSAPAPDAPPRKQVIALVDDDGQGATQLADGFDAKGYTAAPWRWGNGLHAMIARERPDLLVIDVPRARRRALWLVLRRMEQDPTINRIPVVLLSEDEPRLPGAHGQRHVLFKPVERRTLYAAVEALVGPPPPRPAGRAAPRQRSARSQPPTATRNPQKR